MPKEHNLPNTISEVCFHNGMPVRRDPDFHRDMERLIVVIEGFVGRLTGKGRRTSDRSKIREFLEILRRRAEGVIRYLDETRDQSVTEATRSWFASSKVQEIVRHSEAIKDRFMQLHKEHLAAVEAGQVHLAHEIVNEIHCLLFIRARHDFWSLSPPGICYSLHEDCFGTPLEYSRYYPGPAEGDLRQFLLLSGLARTPPKGFSRAVMLMAEHAIQQRLGGIPKSRRRRFSRPSGYGLGPDNPVVCGGEEGLFDYLNRLRCPSGAAVNFTPERTVTTRSTGYLDRPGVRVNLGAGTSRRIEREIARLEEVPLRVYSVMCKCGKHNIKLYIDAWHKGVEEAVGVEGWTLQSAAEAEAEKRSRYKSVPCPYCGKRLLSAVAKQCFECGMDWHDPSNVVCRKK
jgi:hypothetical protein